MCKRFLYLIALILGLLGVVGSLAAIFCIWTCETRVERTAKKILGTIDDSLTVAQRRLGQTKERVEGLKFTTEEITTTIASWTKSEAKERLASQLEVTEKAQRIEAGLQQADHWLELTESSIQFVQQVVEMAIEIGAPLQTNFAEGSLEELALLRKEVAEAIEPLKRIQEHAAGEGLDEERLRRIRELCLRVVATITSVDARLVRLDDRLAKFTERLSAAQIQMQRWIRVAAICVTLLIVWIAAGQCALCYFGRIGWRRGRLATSADPAISPDD